jgi:hypothetical protein
MHLSSTVIAAALILSACRNEVPPPASSEHHGILLIDATPTIPVAAYVKSVADDAHRAGRQLLVYVGASWCEPCNHFHQAAAHGELDSRFPQLTLLVFDADRDADRLSAAGYDSSMIPLFAIPADDGRSSSRRMEGSIKGDGAVAEITPRLAALLAAP